MDDSITYHKTIKGFVVAGAVWALVATIAGLVNQLQLLQLQSDYLPVPDSGSLLSYGFLRPIYTTSLIFGAGLSLFIAGAYYIVQKVDGVTLKFEYLGLATFGVIQGAAVMGVLTILMGANKGREYGEMSFISDNLIALGLVLVLVSLLISIWKVQKIGIASTFVVLTLAAGLAVYVLGNVGQPLPPLQAVPLQSGMQDASVQEFYRTGVLVFFILTPAFALLYYFLPSYYRLPLFSESLANFQAMGMLLAAALAGAAGLAYTAAPGIIQTVGIFASFSLAAAIIAGVINLHSTVAASNSGVRSDRFGLMMRWGIVLLGFMAILRAVRAPRFMQEMLGYTWWNPLDLAVDAQTYGLLILFGAAYILAQRVTGQTAYRGTAGLQLTFMVIGSVLILTSDMAHGIVQAVNIQELDGEGKIAVTRWTDIIYAGSFYESTDIAWKYLFSLRGLHLLGFLFMVPGVLLGTLNILQIFIKQNQPYNEPDLHHHREDKPAEVNLY